MQIKETKFTSDKMSIPMIGHRFEENVNEKLTHLLPIQKGDWQGAGLSPLLFYIHGYKRDTQRFKYYAMSR